jgi:hypothetical protein
MAAISAFPDLKGKVIQGVYADDLTFTAKSAVLAGQVVTFDGTDKEQVIPTTATNATVPVGVAISDAGAGEFITVRVTGIAYVANGDASTAIDPGAGLTPYTYAGAVIAGGTGSATAYIVGYAIDTIAGGGTGRVRIAPGIVTKAAT